ncbi:MAG: hypothetical protein MUP81_00595 [Dehalococcoidia bacterium]|nr:hypothetical protein [Dehalococcoidia bacterium]
MANIEKAQRVLGFEIWKKLGKPGDPDPYDVLGIYRRRPGPKGVTIVKMDFYDPGPPTHPGQIAAQDKFRAGVAAWQALTQEQKNQYNENAKDLEMYGFNLFLREYMLS